MYQLITEFPVDEHLKIYRVNPCEGYNQQPENCLEEANLIELWIRGAYFVRFMPL